MRDTGAKVTSRASMALKAFGESLSHGRHDTNGALANAAIRSTVPMPMPLYA